MSEASGHWQCSISFFLMWHWLIKLYRFPAYNSVTHHLYMALCVYHWSPISFCHHIFGPAYPLLTPSPLSLWEPSYCCVCEFLFVLFVHLLLLVLYPTHEWKHMVLDFFKLISLTMMFSRSIHAFANGSISSFLMAEYYSIAYVFFTQSSREGYFGCFYDWATMNKSNVLFSDLGNG